MRKHQGRTVLLFLFLAGGIFGCEAPAGLSASNTPGTPGAPITPLPSTSPSHPTFSPRPSTASNETVCANSATLAGLDVSDYQPNTAWPTVHSEGKSFAFVKATEGTTIVNPDFASDWATLKNVGMTRGAYHYFHPSQDPLTQANYFLSLVGTLSPSDLPPVLDWEETDGVAPALEITNALTWLEQVESVTGKVPIIYVDPSFWNALGNPVEFARYPLFIANYEVTCPEIPPPWITWTFWQQGSGSLSGVQTQVDLDQFNGNSDQLAALAANSRL